MKIQGINGIPFFYNHTGIDKKNKNKNSDINKQEIYTTPSISFEAARVDKGLTRFYEVNASRMPQTVKTYIENLGDKTLLTPLTAQKNAFAKLREAKNASDIKRLFPDEALFKNLIDPDKSKATRGILGIFRENKELLDVCNQGILSNNENLTVYLVKKIFLEGKTLDEMNNDLREDGDTDFLAMFDQKEGGKLLRSSTLKALGIEQPEFEYLQSLRYTRDGYSDLVGEKISQVQRAFWESMPIEERTARARRSVEKFENWWKSLTRDQQLDKIAAQADELELLEEFNKSEFGKTKKAAVSQPKVKEAAPVHQKTGVTSTLSRDDLFKIWAANNLRIFTANLSKLDKRTLQIKRTQNAAQRWERMTPAEKTEYISKLKAASEPLKYAMIDAWNNNPDIIVEMSIFLKKQQIHKPVDDLYSGMEFSSFMSKAMTEFWEEHPEFAAQLGDSIKESHQKVKGAISGGHFEILKAEILKNKKTRIKEIDSLIKNYREINIDFEGMRPIVKEFAGEYLASIKGLAEYLPDEYFQDYFNTVNKSLNDEQITSWLKFLRDESITLKDVDNINFIKTFEPMEAKIMNRSLEAALEDTLYLCTKDPEVFRMSQSDAKYALLQIINNQSEISLFSEKTSRKFEIPVLSRNIDKNIIKELYHLYKQPLDSYELNSIIDQFIRIKFPKTENPEMQKVLDAKKLSLLSDFCEYILSYGHSIVIPFSHNNYPPEVKAAFIKKFMANKPGNVSDDIVTFSLSSINDFQKEEIVKDIDRIVRKRNNNMPKEIIDLFCYEFDKTMRVLDERTLNTLKNTLSDYYTFLPEVQDVKSLPLQREYFNSINNLYYLCAEQTIADALYKATGNPKVYALTLNELLAISEVFSHTKTSGFSSSGNKKDAGIKIIDSAVLGEPIQLKLKQKLNLYKNDEIYEDYKKEILEYLHEMKDYQKEIDAENLLYILNPDENKKEVDNYTQKRIDYTLKYIKK